MAGSTLHAAQCTQHTAPANWNAPEPEPVHFILHIKNCTLHAIHLYYMLQNFHFALQTSKICMSGTQDLHGKIYLKRKSNETTLVSENCRKKKRFLDLGGSLLMGLV